DRCHESEIAARGRTKHVAGHPPRERDAASSGARGRARCQRASRSWRTSAPRYRSPFRRTKVRATVRGWCTWLVLTSLLLSVPFGAAAHAVPTQRAQIGPTAAPSAPFEP